MRYVGIDPGQRGAAVVIGDDGVTVIEHQVWARQKTPPAITVVRPGDVVALEAQHVRGPHASIVLAHWCGMLEATLPEGITLLRPLATTWRARVFRAGRMRREPAKALAVQAATQYFAEVPGHDLAEAWALGRYAWGWARAHA